MVVVHDGSLYGQMIVPLIRHLSRMTMMSLRISGVTWDEIQSDGMMIVRTPSFLAVGQFGD